MLDFELFHLFSIRRKVDLVPILGSAIDVMFNSLIVCPKLRRFEEETKRWRFWDMDSFGSYTVSPNPRAGTSVEGSKGDLPKVSGIRAGGLLVRQASMTSDIIFR